MANPRAAELMAQFNATMKLKPGDSGALSMGSNPEHKVKYLPTGLLPFDILMPGGLPRGRMVEVFGGPSSLKSYLGLCAIANTQAAGHVAALIDTEHTFDPEWAERIGVNIKELILQQPETGEEGFDAAELLIRNGVDLLSFDSIAAAQPQVESDQKMSGNKNQPGRHASLFSKGLRKITAPNKHTAILFMNQLRTNIGVTFGSPEVTPGGKAPAFYASLRMRMQKAGAIHQPAKVFDGEKWVDSRVQVAQKFSVSMEKSKLSSPFGSVQFVWSLEAGQIDMVTFAVMQGMDLGLIDQTGSSWTYNGTKVVGREKFLARLASDADLLEDLTDAVRTAHGLSIPKRKIAPKAKLEALPTSKRFLSSEAGGKKTLLRPKRPGVIVKPRS